MLVDLGEDALWRYRSNQSEPHDFDDFWKVTLAASADSPLDVRTAPIDIGLVNVRVFDFSFRGYEGQRVKGWLLVPAGLASPAPAVVRFVGYGGGRGNPLENLVWPVAGFVQVVMDTRGQGGIRRAGATPDEGGSGPSAPGFLTRGIESPLNHYYRRLIVDAVRCITATAELPHVDSDRVAAVGRSQGGGIALAAAALHPGVAALVSQVPFLCDIARAITITNDAPYSEVVEFLATHRGQTEMFLETLSYFDGANFAPRATAPAWFSAALMDSTCPPSTVFGAYHRYAGDKDMKVWKYNGHEGGDFDDEQRAIDALRRLFGMTSVSPHSHDLGGNQ